jgi:DNA-directed RNA polymerase subunit RPC12/RpoP
MTSTCIQCGFEYDLAKRNPNQFFTPESEGDPITFPKYCNQCHFDLGQLIQHSSDKELLCEHCKTYSKIIQSHGKRICEKCRHQAKGCHHNSLKLITTKYDPNEKHIAFACKRCPVDVFYTKEQSTASSCEEPIIPWRTPIEIERDQDTICVNCGNTTSLAQNKHTLTCTYCLMSDAEQSSTLNKLIACPYCNELSTQAGYLCGHVYLFRCPKCRKDIRGCTHENIALKYEYDPTSKYITYQCLKCFIELYLEKTPARFGRSIIIENSEPVSLIPQEEFVCQICKKPCLIGEGLYPGCCKLEQKGYAEPKMERCKFHRECIYQWKLNYKLRFQYQYASCPICYAPIR